MSCLEMKNNFTSNDKIVIYGGSFDPIHKGHLEVIHYVINHLEVDKVILLLSKVSPFKVDSYVLSAEERLNLVKIALEDYRLMYGEAERKKIEIDTYEIDNEKKYSYTSETVFHYVNDMHYTLPINFIIGDDILLSLSKWHNVDYIKKNVHFIVLNRSSDNIEIERTKSTLIDSGFSFTFLDNPLFVSSSTEVKNGDLSLLSSLVKKEFQKLGRTQ